MDTNEAQRNGARPRPRKAGVIWIAPAAIALFVLLIVFAVLRPIVDRQDGRERGVPQVNRPAITQTGP